MRKAAIIRAVATVGVIAIILGALLPVLSSF